VIALRLNQPVRTEDVLAHARVALEPHDWTPPADNTGGSALEVRDWPMASSAGSRTTIRRRRFQHQRRPGVARRGLSGVVQYENPRQP